MLLMLEDDQERIERFTEALSMIEFDLVRLKVIDSKLHLQQSVTVRFEAYT